MATELTELTSRALAEISASADVARLEEVRVHWLGKKGVLTEQLKSLGALPASERPAAGAKINEAKVAVQAALESRRATLDEAEISRQLSAGRVDVTLDGRGEQPGGLHPVTRARLRIERLFRDARLSRIHPTNSALSHEVIAKLTLGIDPDAQPRWG